VVEGERMQVGLITIKRGTRSRPHSHPNEQWTYVLKGRARVRWAASRKPSRHPHADLRPPNVVHSVEALPEEDLVFFPVKDLRTASSARPRG